MLQVIQYIVIYYWPIPVNLLIARQFSPFKYMYQLFEILSPWSRFRLKAFAMNDSFW